jgi:hypothetical protein
MIIMNYAVEGRVILKVGPVIGCLHISAHDIDVPDLAGLEKSPTGYGLTSCRHGPSLPHQVIERQYL